MTDAQSLSEGLERTSQLAKWAIGFLMFGIGVGFGASLYASLNRHPTVKKVDSQTRCNFMGQPAVDDGGCAELLE